MDGEILNALRAIEDPEIGVNVVDIGLVQRAERGAGGVVVELTATSHSCPLGEFMREEARSRLAEAFPKTGIEAELGWTPWRPERMNAAARRQLGL